MDPGPIFTIDTSSTITCLLAANHYLPHHTFNPLLHQTSELYNLIDSLGQSHEFVLCSVTTSVNYAPRFKPGCSEMVEIVRRGPNAHTGRPFGRPNHFQTTGLERAA